MRLFLLLLIVPIVEIVLFIEIGGRIGTWPTIAIVVLTALLGTVMLRRQGVSALRNVQARLAAGENPGRLLADGAMILVAGALLLTPGFFTDAVGFALLFPTVRRLVWNWLAPRLTVVQVETRRAEGRRMPPHGSQAPGGPGGPGGQTIEGEYEEVEPEPTGRRGPRREPPPRAP
jgi:UPF0716 protein FxsA